MLGSDSLRKPPFWGQKYINPGWKSVLLPQNLPLTLDNDIQHGGPTENKWRLKWLHLPTCAIHIRKTLSLKPQKILYEDCLEAFLVGWNQFSRLKGWYFLSRSTYFWILSILPGTFPWFYKRPFSVGKADFCHQCQRDFVLKGFSWTNKQHHMPTHILYILP